MKILQSCPNINLEEYEAMRECFETNWLTEGPKSKQFVDEICKLQNIKYGVLAPNGTLALYLGLMALDIQEGDKIIIPDCTFIASANAVLMCRAKPIFVDINLNDFQIDIDNCENILKKDFKDVKAIMPVHLFGMSCDMTKVMKFAKKYNLKIIEDACQGIGIKWKNKFCGSFGDVGCFSFFADKTLSTIEGCFVGTNNKKIYEKLLYLRNQGRLNRGSFIHPEIGFNFRMNDIQSAIGLVQIKKFSNMSKRKLEIYELYKENLNGVRQIKITEPEKNSNFIPFRVTILCGGDQQDLSDYLKDKGIESRTFFYPLHKQPCFEKLNYQSCDDKYFPNSIYAFNHGICLPVHYKITNEDVIYICDMIKKYYGE